jgi:predicted transcriptional regulator
MAGEEYINQPLEEYSRRTSRMLSKVKGEIDLLERHLEVLRTVVEHQPIGIMKLSELMDMPYHRIRYSLRVLEQLGYIRASPAGAVATSRSEELLCNLDQHLEELREILGSMKSGTNP